MNNPVTHLSLPLKRVQRSRDGRNRIPVLWRRRALGGAEEGRGLTFAPGKGLRVPLACELGSAAPDRLCEGRVLRPDGKKEARSYLPPALPKLAYLRDL